VTFTIFLSIAVKRIGPAAATAHHRGGKKKSGQHVQHSI